MPQNEYPVVTTGPGTTRQVLAQNDQMMLVSFTFQTGSEGALHSHPHVQSTYIRAGRFEFRRGDETLILQPGDALTIDANVTHGCRCLEAGELIDSFTPRRDDFL
ncbi:cupin domain-containing protein [Paracoccus sp. CPCC 101403]|uniref:Cupin domain-containing protein n=1 Tax=Paracoccus broussonetiae TaxID=3075834 RepID=A0ABU3E9I2_9RHOB|nr:cupin domain-containing protein [Paracoccus sp. CPCC 101403]MDT1060873.1 cupin domain-containing protein [Paracoccus sp. CPCC 101403]